MRKLMGALCVAGLMAGCGGTMEDAQTPEGAETSTSTAVPANDADGKVGALAACRDNQAHYARYFYDESGRECGLMYWFCDGREAGRGCETSNYTIFYNNCSCP